MLELDSEIEGIFHLAGRPPPGDEGAALCTDSEATQREAAQYGVVALFHPGATQGLFGVWLCHDCGYHTGTTPEA